MIFFIGKRKDFIFIFTRYFFILVIGLLLPFFSRVLFHLTIFPIYSILRMLYHPVIVYDNTLFVGHYAIVIVDACVATSAYYLLLLLNFGLAMPLKKRILSLVFSFSLFFLLNILRILFLTYLFVYESIFFKTVHLVFWHIMSTLFVVGIWFISYVLFSIHGIPFYSDIKKLIAERKSKK